MRLPEHGGTAKRARQARAHESDMHLLLASIDREPDIFRAQNEAKSSRSAA
jgi:hypothetical protein